MIHSLKPVLFFLQFILSFPGREGGGININRYFGIGLGIKLEHR